MVNFKLWDFCLLFVDDDSDVYDDVTNFEVLVYEGLVNLKLL